MTGTASLSGVLVVRAPLAVQGLHYRAYEEEWAQGSVFDWIIGRFLATASSGADVVCVCDSPAERERLGAANHTLDDSQIVCIRSRGERHLCRVVMEQYAARKVTLTGFSHAVGSADFVRHMSRIHTALDSELSDLAGATFQEPLYIVESTLLDEMDRVVLPNLSETTLLAAEQLRAAHRKDGQLAREFLWARIDVAKSFGLTPDQWPEQITIRRPRDVAVLRSAWRAWQTGDGQGSLVKAWKQEEIRRRRESTAAARPKSRTAKRAVRILYASHLPGFTGAHQSMIHLVGAIDRARYEPIALVSHEGTFTQQLRQRDVPVICPETDISAPGIERFRFARQIIAEYKPDILHAQHHIGPGLICAAVAAGVPMVQHVRIPNVSALRYHIHAADVVIAVSAYIRQRLAELDVDPAKIEVVLNGVDPDVFGPSPSTRSVSRRSLGIPDDEFVVLIIARMSRKKRHDVVIKAVARLRQSLGRGHLVMVGARDGDLPYQHEIQTCVQALNLVSHVSQIEFAADIRPILHACDVMALLSEDEPLSRAVLDSMAVGLPTIVSDSGGSKEVVDQGSTGIVVRSGDVNQLADALVALAANDQMRTAMGAAARDKIRAELTAVHCATRTAWVYERLLRGEYHSQPADSQQADGLRTAIGLEGF